MKQWNHWTLGIGERDAMKGADIISSLGMEGEEMWDIEEDAQVSGLGSKMKIMMHQDNDASMI